MRRLNEIEGNSTKCEVKDTFYLGSIIRSLDISNMIIINRCFVMDHHHNGSLTDIISSDLT